jgi:hypothetical protein
MHGAPQRDAPARSRMPDAAHACCRDAPTVRLAGQGQHRCDHKEIPMQSALRTLDHDRRPPWLPRHAGLLAAGLLLAAPLLASAQPHEEREGDYVLRSSVVQSTALDPATARAHGIEPAPGRGVLNVSVRGQGGAGPALPATAEATLKNMTGLERRVELREARAPNGWVSYTGAFEFAPREVLDVRVRAQPLGGGPALELAYRERMPVR